MAHLLDTLVQRLGCRHAARAHRLELLLGHGRHAGFAILLRLHLRDVVAQLLDALVQRLGCRHAARTHILNCACEIILHTLRRFSHARRELRREFGTNLSSLSLTLLALTADEIRELLLGRN